MKTDRELLELAEAWAKSQEIEGDRSESEWEPIFALHSLVAHPETLWRFIVIAEPICTSATAFGMLGTGPLEDLIAEYGEAFIGRLELLAKQNPRFAELFQHVWIDAGEDPLTLRYLALGCVAVGPPA